MMSKKFGKPTWITALVAGLFILATQQSAHAQFGTVNQIGGVWINPSGVLDLATEQMQRDVRLKVLNHLKDIGDEAKQSSNLRTVSLRGLEAALAHAAKTGTELSDEVKFLAGIQRILYIVAVPEKNDILIVGPGEAWTVDGAGNVVGETTGRPVIRFEDLIVAMRTADSANEEYGISVSIDPTEEGLRQLSELFRRNGFAPGMKDQIEEALGPQDITLKGMPTDSRMAQVLVAADYKMKRLAMGHEQAAIDGLPSILEMARDQGKNMKQSPRFWLETSYDSIKRSEDGLVWQITGSGAKAQTENMLASGKVKDHPISKEWAENMTEKFGELADADPVFAELQNLMDLTVVAAVIRKHDLLGTVSMDVPTISGENQQVELPKWNVPVSVGSECSFVQVRNSWVVTASGGVQVDSWGAIENAEIDNAIASIVAKVAINDTTDKVFWNSIN